MSAYLMNKKFVLASNNDSRIETTKYVMHTVSIPLGVRRVGLRTLLLWASHIDVFPKQRGLEEYIGRMQARKRDT